MQDVAESCHRDGPLCADLQFNTYTEYRWRREDNGSDRGIGGRAPKQPHRVYLRVPGLPQDAFQRCRLVRPAGKNCSLRSSWLILWAYVGLLGEPKSFSHGQDPTETLGVPKGCDATFALVSQLGIWKSHHLRRGVPRIERSMPSLAACALASATTYRVRLRS